MKRPLVAIASLAAGIFLLLEGSKLSSGSIVLDLVMVGFGALLTVSYLPLMGNYLERRFRSSTSLTYMPIFAIIGLGLLWQAASRVLLPLDQVIFGVVGGALLVGSAFAIYRAIKVR